ncbi:Os12g0249500 [Oryza sativa Japonica Group]|uniref:Os12g0249500 protein n=2 Tax=Oryza TaxID=4527 RepID=A0A0P0Y8J8_ORYSJ|nr:Os12g0249500 [Oryza sativa Japonica Group]
MAAGSHDARQQHPTCQPSHGVPDRRLRHHVADALASASHDATSRPKLDKIPILLTHIQAGRSDDATLIPPSCCYKAASAPEDSATKPPWAMPHRVPINDSTSHASSHNE